jgi:outer membrane protein assembly factor BamB
VKTSRPRPGAAALVIALTAALAAATARASDEWPQFRGAGAAGLADAVALPEAWSPSRNVAWSTEIPGRGWSSPVVWRDRVFVTSAVSPGSFKEPSTGIFGNDYVAEIVRRVVGRDIELTSESGEISYRVYALDARTGRVLWEHEAHRGAPHGGRHRKNTYASETPATDGQRLYVSFGGNVGIFCYSLDGRLLWTRSWAPQPIYLDFGTASSPIVHRGRVYQLHDNDGDSFLAALDAATGEELWRVKRTDSARMTSGWATPLVWENDARTEIVTIGRGLVVSYGLDGRELWRLKGMTQATPSPVAADGLLYVGSGSQGEANRPLLAIRPGASGDISLAPDQTSSEFVVWHQPRFSGYTTSPLVYGGRIYAINDNGVLQVADARTGREIYKARVGGGGHTFSSSPIASRGRIYALSEEGETFVLRAGDTYQEIARNRLDEMSLATPAAASDSLYVRTQSKLYRIRSATPAG